MNRSTQRLLAAALAVLSTSALFLQACDESSNAVKEPSPALDGSTAQPDGQAPSDGSVDGGPSDCVQNPQTHEDIINACTTAQRVVKNPTLDKLLPDGGLPPLP